MSVLQNSIAGHYFLANGYTISNEIRIHKTILTSPLHQTSSIQCLQFFYHKGGKKVSHLSVHFRTNSTSRYLLLKLVGEEPHEWSLATIDLPAGEYQVEFQAQAVDDESLIAIDDTRVFDGPCDKSCKSLRLIMSQYVYT